MLLCYVVCVYKYGMYVSMRGIYACTRVCSVCMLSNVLYECNVRIYVCYVCMGVFV